METKDKIEQYFEIIEKIIDNWHQVLFTECSYMDEHFGIDYDVLKLAIEEIKRCI